MNDFFAAFGRTSGMKERAASLFDELRGSRMSVVHDSADLLVLNAPQSKVISDIFAQDQASASWLALLGMPLVENRTDAFFARLMREFLDDPKRALRESIDGHFAAFAYDAGNKTFYVANDICSFIPVYFSTTRDAVLISSSELVLARLNACSVNRTALAESIIFGSAWGESRFSGIQKLRPHSLISINVNGAIVKPYWSPTNESLWKTNFEDTLHEWLSLLDRSISSFLNNASNCQVSSDITGGEDSRLLVSLLNHKHIDFKLRVHGQADNKDVCLAKFYGTSLGLDIRVDEPVGASEAFIAANTLSVAMGTDGYGSWLNVCDVNASLCMMPPLEHTNLHFSGVPGGEVYRGDYYLRAGLLKPDRRKRFQSKRFIYLKFLLDFAPDLFVDGVNLLEGVFAKADATVDEVSDFPIGTQVDHLLRIYQVCALGTSGFARRQPFYWPLGLRDMTRSIYNLPPAFKQGSKLTRAATEFLYPAFARLETDESVPTLRRTVGRWPLFMPGYYAKAKKFALGGARRMLRYQQSSSTLARRHRADIHAPTMKMLLTNSPYAAWFASPSSMITGDIYAPDVLNDVLVRARTGSCNRVESLGRIINAEFAVRFARSETSA